MIRIEAVSLAPTFPIMHSTVSFIGPSLPPKRPHLSDSRPPVCKLSVEKCKTSQSQENPDDITTRLVNVNKVNFVCLIGGVAL